MPKPSPTSTDRSKVGMLVPPPLLLIGLALASTAAQLTWLGRFTSSPLRVAAGWLLMAVSVFKLQVRRWL